MDKAINRLKTKVLSHIQEATSHLYSGEGKQSESTE